MKYVALIVFLLLASCASAPRHLDGHLTYAGRPIGSYTNVQPAFWFRDETTGKVLEGITTTYDPATSAFSFANLPVSTVGIAVTLHVAGDKRTLPGNFDLWHEVDLRGMQGEASTGYELPLGRIMHLLAPADNGHLLHHSASGYPSHPSPVEVKWERLDGASVYQVTVNECRDTGHPDYASGCARCTSVAFAQTQYPYAALALPPSGDLTHFEISLVATDMVQRPLGKLMITYDDAYGWDYRFRVPDSGKPVTVK